MIKNKKQMFLVIGVFVIILMLTTVTYAFFNYTRTGIANRISVGRISFVTRQTETINLTNVFPIEASEATGENPNYDEVVIEIVGDTDYAGGIEYLVSAVDTNIYTTAEQIVPVSLDINIEDDLGEENNDYLTARENTNVSIYKRIGGDTLVGDEMLLVGYIVPNTSGNIDGIDATISIKAYLDKNKIKITDTFDGTESDNMGTTNEWVENNTVLTATEWNQLQTNGISFKIKVEANEGIWVIGSLEEIMRKSAIMDNVTSTYVSNSSGIDFSNISRNSNGQGVYMRAGTENDMHPIMYYRGEVTDNNVVFADKCWKAVRTTDTGGVKLIYNGVYNHQLVEEIPIGVNEGYQVVSNTYDDANNGFEYDSENKIWKNVDGYYLTGNSELIISFLENGNYRIVNNFTSGAVDMYKNNSYLSSNIYDGSKRIYDLYDVKTTDEIKIISVSYFNTAGNISIYKLENGDIEYTCNNTGKDTVITFNSDGNFFNSFMFNPHQSPAYVGYMYGDEYIPRYAYDSYLYFNSSFVWDGTNYVTSNSEGMTWSREKPYTCGPSASTCEKIRYYFDDSYYILLSNGDGIEEALMKMETNEKDSIAKEKVETWYANNMTSYTHRIEDTIYCNDRSKSSLTSSNFAILYSPYERSMLTFTPSVDCINKNDSFTWESNKGNKKLNYPVGLITIDEIVLAGGRSDNTNSSFYLNNRFDEWTMSPSGFDFSYSDVFSFHNSGYINWNAYTTNNYGLRPVISIKPGQLIVKGTGTISDPYVID